MTYTARHGGRPQSKPFTGHDTHSLWPCYRDFDLNTGGVGRRIQLPLAAPPMTFVAPDQSGSGDLSHVRAA